MSLLSEEDIVRIRKASKIVAQTLKLIESIIKPGIKTIDLDEQAAKFILSNKAIPAFKGYQGYPANICVSINEEIVHGIPGERQISDCDIVSVDVGVEFEGIFSDAASTFAVGGVSSQAKKLMKVTREALNCGIAQVKPGNKLFDISAAIQQYAEKNGFSVVRQFVGHGIGRELHADPQIPNFGKAGTGPVLKAAMALAIEPMINAGTWEAEVLDNGWTAVTKDRKLSAHFEHTILITEKGCEVLTRD